MAQLLLVLFLLLSSAAAQSPLFRVGGGLRPGARRSNLGEALSALFRGPSGAERAQGFGSALPAGLRMLHYERRGAELRIWLSKAGAGLLAQSAGAEDAIEQVVKTCFLADSQLSSVGIWWKDSKGDEHPLADLMCGKGSPLGTGSAALPLLAPQKVQGALSGKTIVVSPGHGYYWHSSLGWITQRAMIGGLIEDVHTAEIARRFVVPYLENLGARVILCRDPGENAREIIADNDYGHPVYSETGAWIRSVSSGYKGLSYRFSNSSATSLGKATWKLNVAKAGYYTVSATYRASGNRCRAARYHVHHSGGVATVEVDQTRDNLTWRRLGEWWFEPGIAKVELDTASSDVGRPVIADAVRLGSGMGVIVRGSGTSGKGKWLEASRYWAQLNGAPSSVWNSSSSDNSDDVTCRPRFAEYLGADAFVSIHTNAGGGAGTSSFIHNTRPTSGSYSLQRAIHTQLVGDIRRLWDRRWVDRGRKTANFGELRLLRTMPGALFELAFHDTNNSRDHDAIHHPRWRRIAGRAIARGVLRYFQPSAPFAPVAPELSQVVQDGKGGLRVQWQPVSGATSYSVEISKNGKAFQPAAKVSGNSWSTGLLPYGAVRSFRVRAANSSGRSEPSQVLTAGCSHRRKAELLLVAGFDRLGESIKSPENTFDYLRQHGDAIRRHGKFSLGFDACSNEAVEQRRIALPSYSAVIWQLGEESTKDETFSGIEQWLVGSYLKGGGRLMVSGSEIAWDLGAKGSTTDRRFLEGQLGVRYVKDDARVYFGRDVPGELFAGLGFFSFDDGSQGTYDVDWPDVIAPSDKKSRVVLHYGTSSRDGAAVARIDGQSRVLVLGFPLETLYPESQRAEFMARALRFLLAGRRPLDMDSSLAIPSSNTIQLSLPGAAGDYYALGASAATSPGIPIGGIGTLALVPDGLWAASFGQSNGVFQGFVGSLDAQGKARAYLNIPNAPALRGLRFYVSGLTVAKSSFQVSAILPWYQVRL